MPQIIPDFQFTIEKYALHNARPDPIDFMWNGMRFTIPGVEAVGTKPAQFAETGEPIPGTLVVQDSYTAGLDGVIPVESAPNWRAKEALRAVLGVNATTGMAEGKLALNGISVIPVVCSKEQYEAIRADGNERYKTSLIEWAMETVAAYEVARSKAKEAGVDPKPPGREFYQAQQILTAHNETEKKKLGVEADALELAADSDDELEFRAFALAMAEKIAAKAAEAQGVDKMKLVEQLIEDPTVAANLRKKYSLRKRGYMDPATAPGAEQPPAKEAV